LLEITLAVMLFTDATQVSVRSFLRTERMSRRLLGVGFPLTVAAGYLAGVLLFPDTDPWVIALIAAALAATDAGLAAAVIEDRRVPRDLRTAINIESGLNDGLATPLVLFFLAAAVATEAGDRTSPVILDALAAIAIAVAVGAALGVVLGWLLRRSRIRRWSTGAAQRAAYLALAILAFEVTHLAHGNGFVAAFVAGMAVRAVDTHLPEDVLNLAHDTGALLSAGVWFAFGTLIPHVLSNNLTWHVALYTALSLTAVRMLPVALSLVGLHRTRRDILFVGWLGPRGLATVIFALIALEELTGPPATLVATVATTTVLISVVAHGLSAGPIADHWPPEPRHPRLPQGVDASVRETT
jgi:NhaP-type Na+/H+ or K+/H+ antiporter